LTIIAGIAFLVIGLGIALAFYFYPPSIPGPVDVGPPEISKEVKSETRRHGLAAGQGGSPVALGRLTRGIAAFDQNDLETARREFESLAREAPELPDGYFWLGRVAARYQQWENGIEYLDEALKRNDAFAPAHLLRFKLLIMNERSTEAELLKELARMQGKDAGLGRWVKCFLDHDGVKKVYASLEGIGRDCPPVGYELPAGAGLR